MSPREAPQTFSGSEFKLQGLAEARLSRGNAATFPRVRRPREIPGARRAEVGLCPHSAEVGRPPGFRAQVRGPAPRARAPPAVPRGGGAGSLGGTSPPVPTIPCHIRTVVENNDYFKLTEHWPPRKSSVH